MEVNTNTDHIIDGFIDIRKKKKLSQAAVAKRADLHQAAVGRIENKSTNPQLDTIIKLLNTMGYTLAIVPDDRDSDHALIIDIYNKMESLDDANLKKVNDYVEALSAQEINERMTALMEAVELTKDVNLGPERRASYKELLLEELDRRYGLS